MTEIKQSILSFKDSRDLTKAVSALEKNSLIKNLSEFTGRPIEEMLAKVPKPIKKQIERSVEQLTYKCLDLAIKSHFVSILLSKFILILTFSNIHLIIPLCTI